MYVIHSESGQKHQATINRIDAKEIAQINKTKRFDFNWNKEKLYEVYKLTAHGVDMPLGLMSIQERPEDYAIEIRLLAISKENIGKNKHYQRIAGCLIALACEKAFKIGYEGYICLKPKTELKNHYITRYGFESTKLFLISEGKNSLKLIDKYYEN